jgi:hypothetical protein
MIQTHPEIRWPSGLEPSAAHLHTVNSLDIPHSPDQIWPWLVRASRWPEYYRNCRRIRIDGDLTGGVAFRWWTFGVPVRTVVDDFAPCARLAWRGTGAGAIGYHAWILEPTTTGSRVITEETQRGAVPWLARLHLRRGLLHWHQRWLEGLARVAGLGHPDQVSTHALQKGPR